MTTNSIKNFEPRLYQQTILATAALKNTLIVLPTGLGKTHIFVLITAQRLKQYPNSKILLLGPTRPLIDQYRAVFEKYLDIAPEKICTFTGSISPEKRANMWTSAQIILSTPQGLENDVLTGKIDLKEVSLLGFDEAHRAVGNYSYVWIAEQYNQKARFPRIVGLTASPGSDKETIQEVCRNLHIEEIEMRSEKDHDVKPYVQEINIQWVQVDFTEELKKIQHFLKECYKSKLKGIQEKGYIKSIQDISKRELLGIQASLHAELAIQKVDFDAMKAISICAEALKVQHAIELIETQGIEPLHKYILDLQKQSLTTSTKAVLNLVKDINFRSAVHLTEEAVKKQIQHPKLTKLKEIVTKIAQTEKENLKIIIFNQYRDSALAILNEIKVIPNSKPALFVGQQKKGSTGMSQKEQLQTIEDFKNGVYNILIMTSVGEEGLDIPSVDHVIFYEPIPSAIRQIQRRGRTGRQDKGSVIILITKDTRDEIYRWSAHHKEKKMYTVLKDIRKNGLDLFNATQEVTNTKKTTPTSVIQEQMVQKNKTSENLDKYITPKSKVSQEITKNSKDSLATTVNSQNYAEQKEEIKKNIEEKQNIVINDEDKQKNNKIVIYVDYREKANQVPKILNDFGVQVKLEQLVSADYIVSARCGIEFKTAPDFVQSLIDGRLLEQVSQLTKNFERPIILIEEKESIYGLRNVHPNAIRGLIATITVDFRIPTIFTKDSIETAQTIMTIAKREQETKENWLPNIQKKGQTSKEIKETIVGSLPNIGPIIARELLAKLGSVTNIINASEEELQKIEKIGKNRATEIRKILDESYTEKE